MKERLNIGKTNIFSSLSVYIKLILIIKKLPILTRLDIFSNTAKTSSAGNITNFASTYVHTGFTKEKNE